MKKTLLIVAALFAGVSAFAQTYGEITDVKSHEVYTPSFKSDASSKAPVNVILMIGDGMGLGHIASGMFVNDGAMTITNLKSIGFSRTQSYSDFTTDSAASGTAYACGIKTYNGAIGLDANGNVVKDIPEKLAPYGIVSGVISTDDITGATPGAFYAHQPSRGMSDEIFGDMANSELTFFSAGSHESYIARPENIRQAVESKYTVVADLNDPAAAVSSKLGYLPGKHLVYDMPEDGEREYLTATTEYAIQYLQQRCNKKKGFFLMVEGARIDKESHGNNYPGMVREMLDFDKAVTAAIKFADQDGHTLVIITADHETGATVLNWAVPSKGIADGMFSSGGHTPMPVPIFAYGPGSRKFACVQENSDVSNKIVELIKK